MGRFQDYRRWRRMGEEAITSGRQKALREAMILLDLAITRSRGNLLNAGLRSRSGVLESGQSRAWQLTTPYGAANDDAHKEVPLCGASCSAAVKGSLVKRSTPSSTL